jgi:hypothetical protein
VHLADRRPPTRKPAQVSQESIDEDVQPEKSSPVSVEDAESVKDTEEAGLANEPASDQKQVSGLESNKSPAETPTIDDG